MSFASRTPNPLLQGLARFCAALMLEAEKYLTKIVPQHIQGIKNIEADALSRVDKKTRLVPSIHSVIKQCSQLEGCRICLVPSKFIQIIASLCSSTKIEVTYGNVMTQVMALEPSFLPSGVIPSQLHSTIY